MTEFAGFDGAYEFMAGGSFKKVFVNEETDSLLYVSKEGEGVEDKLYRVLAWEHNIDRLMENGVDLPFDRCSVVITERDGEVEPVLSVEYDERVRDGYRIRYVEDVEGEEANEEWQAYQQVVEELREDGELAAAAVDSSSVKRHNYGVHPEKGGVLLDFGEVYSDLTIRPTGDHWTAGGFYRDHGIDQRAEALLDSIGKTGLWERVKQAIGGLTSGDDR